MTGAALLQTYRYAEPSSLEGSPGSRKLTLASSPPDGSTIAATPYFFEGKLLAPKRSADAMLTVARVARTRFFTPPAMLAKILAAADPVVTCQPERIRFESFSACAGVYARFDLHAHGFTANRLRSGTTNVDFNADMRALLARPLRLTFWRALRRSKSFRLPSLAERWRACGCRAANINAKRLARDARTFA
jgi:hypothetical protein